MTLRTAHGFAITEGDTPIDKDIFDALKVSLSLISLLPTDGNFVISPQSICTVLAMLYNGARSTTRQELESILHLSTNAVSNFVDSLGNLLQSAASEGTRLRFSTAVYAANGLAVESEYKKFLQRLAANIAHLEFAKNPEVAQEQINCWVDEETEGIIKNLLPPGTISSDTTLVLVNAVYFKGLWNEPFDVQRTRAADFRLGIGRTVTAQMMTLSSRFRYDIDEKRRLQLLLLPYAGASHLNMLLLLPFEGESLDETLAQLNGSILASAVASMSLVKVDVVLPRFTVSSFIDVKSGLGALGIRSLFGNSSDLSGICSAEKLGVSACLHRAVIDVSEEGAEAAAASAAMIESRCMPEQFICDRPFAFAIWHETTGAALFLGRVCDPTQTSGK